jgi:lipid A 3-O-deacylase
VNRNSIPQAFVIAACLASPVFAEPDFNEKTTHLVLGIGYTEVFDSQNDIFWSLELRPSWRFYQIGTWFLFGNWEKDSYYASAGLLLDIPLGERWVLTPSFGAGYYNEGHGLELGLNMEFRSAIELTCRFSNGHRLGIALAHLSNGSLNEVNPGTETLQINWLIPLGRRN